MVSGPVRVDVARERLARWIDNVEDRHGAVTLSLRDGMLHGLAEDGTWFDAALPFGASYDGAPEVARFATEAEPPADWGVLLVRKGGFAIARMSGGAISASKVGQRHVQGRTKAGGQSQQRFARRRDNQARAAYQAAADHAAALLTGVPVLVCGGDRAAVEAVLSDPRLRRVERGRTAELYDVGEPRRTQLEEALDRMSSVHVVVQNAEQD